VAVGFLVSHDLRYIYIADIGRWQQANTQQPIGVVGLMVGYK